MNIAPSAAKAISISSSVSSIQLIEQWDASLKIMPEFKEVAYTIFNGGKYRNPALAQKRDLLAALVTQQARDYFMDGSPLAKLFDRIKKNCVPKKYSSDNAWNKVWTQEFVARHLALFIALHFEREQEHTNAPTRSSRNKRQKGSKTMNDLKLEACLQKASRELHRCKGPPRQ